MWIDELRPGVSWTSLWSGYISCGSCSGIRRFENPCPACGADLPSNEDHVIREEDGTEYVVPATYAGAETRYEDYVYLQLMEREWARMAGEAAPSEKFSHTAVCSTGASIVLLFWTYFETRFAYLLRNALKDVPPRFLSDALKRYSSIGARLDRFYKIAFDSTYAADLVDLGHAHVSSHLMRVQERRNSFAHGSPQSIDDALVRSVVEMLKPEHEAWIAVYNLRVAEVIS